MQTLDTRQRLFQRYNYQPEGTDEFKQLYNLTCQITDWSAKAKCIENDLEDFLN